MTTVFGARNILSKILIIFLVFLLVLPGIALAEVPSIEPRGTPHKPCFVQSINDLKTISVPDHSYPSHPAVPTSVDVDIIELLELLNESMILGYLENITAFGPRVTGTSACQNASKYLYETFHEMGLTVRYHNYTDDTVSGCNVEATLLGSDSTNIFIVCGHYDSVPTSPGADDDGSGVAAVLACAEIMSKYSFGHTVRFVTFSGEEQGLIGSRHYAQDAYNTNDSIVAVLNADMIGFALSESDGNHGKIFENTASEWIVEFTQDISQLYTEYIDIELIAQGETWGSDHYYFWEYGYDAVFYHEYNFNDYYHSANDTIAHMNVSYSTRFSRLILATLAEMAQQPRPVLEISEITGGLGISAQVTNIGTLAATNVTTTIQLTGGIIGLINISMAGGKDSVLPQETLQLQARFFRLGPITIKITAEASNAYTTSKEATGFILGPFVCKVTNKP